MGKAQYMSPEQAQYMATDRRSDIFSLAVVDDGTADGRVVFGTTEDTTMILGNVVQKDDPEAARPEPRHPRDARGRSWRRRWSGRRPALPGRGQDGLRPRGTSCTTRGYGPTIVTLEYMRQLFPRLYVAPLDRSIGDTVPIRRPTEATAKPPTTPMEASTKPTDRPAKA